VTTRLETRGLTITFGGLIALDGVTVTVDEGETVGLIGPNGSGKTTLFNAITGLYPPAAGTIVFGDQRLDGLEPHAIARRGIARTFQSSRLCLELSAFDNVLIGLHAHVKTGLWDALVRRGRFLDEARGALRTASHLLELFNPDLAGRGFTRAGDLPQIDRRRVEICRALASRPRVLLLDEPSAGMNPEETAALMKDLRVVRDELPGLSMVLIEHDMYVIEGVSQRVVAFNYGRKIAEGRYAEVAANDEVRAAYLGRESAARA
jgi:ABC-type branched-subunit amino acid transport system ATPase component